VHALGHPCTQLLPLLWAGVIQVLAPMRALLAILSFTIFVPSASAKCAPRLYVVSGSVVKADGSPASGAMVGASWVEQSVPAGPAMTLTDRNGHYSISVWFDTYSGSSLLFADTCNGALKQVSLSAYTSAQHSQPILVPVGRASQVRAASIQIDNPIRREPLWPDEGGG
jgi:hypothetical protein